MPPITYPPRQRQYPSSLRGLRGKKVSCFQTWRPFFVCEVQQLMRFHQDGGPALIAMKGHKQWIMYHGAELNIILMRHKYGTFQKSSLGWRILVGHRFCHLLGYQILPILQMLPKSKVIHNPHQAYNWDCLGVITGSAGFGGGGHTDFAIF